MYMIPYTNINLKWIKDLIERAKTIKLLEKNTRKKLHDLLFDKGSLGAIPKAASTEKKKVK